MATDEVRHNEAETVPEAERSLREEASAAVPLWARMRHAGEAILRRSLSIASGTWAHMHRCTNAGRLAVQLQVARWRANQQKVRLGEAMYRLGVGSDGLRQEIAELDAAISTKACGRNALRRVAAARRTLIERLAETYQETSERAIHDDVQALSLLHKQIESLTEQRRQAPSLLPDSRESIVELTVGYGATLGLAALVILLLSTPALAPPRTGTRQKDPVDQIAAIDAPPPHVRGAGKDVAVSLSQVDADDASIVDVLLEAYVQDESTQFLDFGYAGYTLGDEFASLEHKLKARGDGASPPDVPTWLLTEDDVCLLFDNERLVGVSKSYFANLRDGMDSLTERFGPASRSRIAMFDSVPRRVVRNLSGQQVRRFTGEQALVRYVFPRTMVYGYISSGDDANLVRPFMAVTVFDRDYVCRALKRDLQQKVQLLRMCEPVAALLNDDSIEWDNIPFPAVDGCQPKLRSNSPEAHVATLTGRRAPGGPPGGPPGGQSTSEAVGVRNYLMDGVQTTAVSISLNCFPTFDTNPILAPARLEDDAWGPCRGNFSVEHDGQFMNACILRSILPPLDDQVDVKTIDNPYVAGGMFDPGSHRSLIGYSWKSTNGLFVEVLANNTILITRRGRLSID